MALPSTVELLGHSVSPVTMGWNFTHLAIFRTEEKGEVSWLLTPTKHSFLLCNPAWTARVCPPQHPWPVSMHTSAGN